MARTRRSKTSPEEGENNSTKPEAMSKTPKRATRRSKTTPAEEDNSNTKPEAVPETPKRATRRSKTTPDEEDNSNTKPETVLQTPKRAPSNNAASPRKRSNVPADEGDNINTKPKAMPKTPKKPKVIHNPYKKPSKVTPNETGNPGTKPGTFAPKQLFKNKSGMKELKKPANAKTGFGGRLNGNVKYAKFLRLKDHTFAWGVFDKGIVFPKTIAQLKQYLYDLGTSATSAVLLTFLQQEGNQEWRESFNIDEAVGSDEVSYYDLRNYALAIGGEKVYSSDRKGINFDYSPFLMHVRAEMNDLNEMIEFGTNIEKLIKQAKFDGMKIYGTPMKTTNQNMWLFPNAGFDKLYSYNQVFEFTTVVRLFKEEYYSKYEQEFDPLEPNWTNGKEDFVTIFFAEGSLTEEEAIMIQAPPALVRQRGTELPLY